MLIFREKSFFSKKENLIKDRKKVANTPLKPKSKIRKKNTVQNYNYLKNSIISKSISQEKFDILIFV
jgi:hypothetical protein